MLLNSSINVLIGEPKLLVLFLKLQKLNNLILLTALVHDKEIVLPS